MRMMPKNSERKITRNKYNVPYLRFRRISFSRPQKGEREKLISSGGGKGVTVDNEFNLRLHCLQQYLEFPVWVSVSRETLTK